MTLDELVDYCLEHASSIVVRGADGKPRTLSALPFGVVMQHINRWHAAGQTPIRVLDEAQ